MFYGNLPAAFQKLEGCQEDSFGIKRFNLRLSEVSEYQVLQRNLIVVFLLLNGGEILCLKLIFRYNR